MVNFEVSSSSIQGVENRLERARERILGAMQVGMQNAMVGLAQFAASRAPVRTGKLAAAILASPKVTTSSNFIQGTVSGDVGKKHVALWDELGIKDPAVSGKLMVTSALFGSKQLFFMSHKAFEIAGKPFMNPALQEYRETIMETIQGKVNEAVQGA